MSQKFTSYVSLYGIGASFRGMLFYLEALWKEEIAIKFVWTSKSWQWPKTSALAPTGVSNYITKQPSLVDLTD